MFEVIKRMIHKHQAPDFDWLQIEISSHCPSSCIYCPHTVYRDDWQNRFMPLEVIEKLVPAFSNTRLVYLQGWGEPFTHPDFFNILSLVKKTGCLAGTSSNGMLLDEKTLACLVDSKLDIIAFSLAGLGKTNNRFRRGTNYDKIIENCQILKKIKHKKNSSLPVINIAYLLVRSGLNELDDLPVRLKDMGINQVVISTLDFIPAREFEQECLHPHNDQEYQELIASLDDTAARAARYDIKLYYHLAHPDRRFQICTENVRKAAFIAVDGSVAPCVFMKLPIKKGFYIEDGHEQEYIPLVFGNINEEPFDIIWQKGEYKKFREAFTTTRPPQRCLHCPKLHMT
ncbi:MAG: radical SAM protein [candidate division Zixibacteria bacterium]|nr:radical SAM protein [candidate division Zixibacteria bacterium]